MIVSFLHFYLQNKLVIVRQYFFFNFIIIFHPLCFLCIVFVFSRRFGRKCTTFTVASFFVSSTRSVHIFLFIQTFSVQTFRSFRLLEGVRRVPVSHLTTSFLMFPKLEGRPKGPPVGYFGTMRLFTEKF